MAGSARADDRPASIVNLLINLVCAVLCLDFVYRAHYLLPSTELEYGRVGYVTSDSVSLSLRSRINGTTLQYWSRDGSIRTASIRAEAVSDSMLSIRLGGLEAGQRYHYNTTDGTTGSFATQRAPADMAKFSILSTSCQKPDWPYSPFSHPLRIQGMEDLHQYLEESGIAPEMMLFLGDFICTSLSLLLARMRRGLRAVSGS